MKDWLTTIASIAATEVAENKPFIIITDVGRSKRRKCATTILEQSVCVHFCLILGMSSSYVSGSCLRLCETKILLNSNLQVTGNIGWYCYTYIYLISEVYFGV